MTYKIKKNVMYETANNVDRKVKQHIELADRMAHEIVDNNQPGDAAEMVMHIRQVVTFALGERKSKLTIDAEAHAAALEYMDHTEKN